MEEFKAKRVSKIIFLRGQMGTSNANLNSSQIFFKSILKTRSVSQQKQRPKIPNLLNESSSILKPATTESNSLSKILTTCFTEQPEKFTPQFIQKHIKQVIPRQKAVTQPFEFTLQGIEYQKLERPSSKQMNKRPTSQIKSRSDPSTKNLPQMSLDLKRQNEVPEYLLAELHRWKYLEWITLLQKNYGLIPKPNDGVYRYYIGKGNNHKLISRLMKSRW